MKMTEGGRDTAFFAKKLKEVEQKEKETCHYEEGKGLPDEVIQLLIMVK